MTSTVSSLTHAARLVNTAIHKLMGIRSSVGKSGDRVNYDALWDVIGDCNQAVNVLTASGADSPEGVERDFSPLSSWELDTPEARELLDLLTRAQTVAEKVDAQRGNVLPDRILTGEMESRGTDFADSISNLRIRLFMEVVPPQGRE